MLEEKLVPLGRNGFQVADVHANKDRLSILVKGVLYTGYLDGVVIPFGALDYVRQMRLGIELKYTLSRKKPSGTALVYPCLRLRPLIHMSGVCTCIMGGPLHCQLHMTLKPM